jgi:GTP-binding protein HflX
LGDLLVAIEDRLGAADAVYQIILDSADGQGLAWLHDRGEVLERQDDPDGRMRVAVRLTAEKAGQAMARFGAAMRPADTRKAAAE